MDLYKQPLLFNLTPFSRLLFSILLVISCFALTFLTGVVMAGPLFGIGMNDIITAMSDFTNVKTVRLLQYFQVIQSFGLFIIPALLAGFFFERNSAKFLRLDRTAPWPVYLITFLLMFTCLPFINWLITMNEAIQLPSFLSGMEHWMKSTEDEAAQLTEVFMNMPTVGGFLFNMLMIALLPAIGEEFMFRGLIQRLIKEWLDNIHVAIFISAFLFSAMHMQFYGFVPRMMLGVIFGYLFFWSGSIWVPVCAHFVNNGSAVIFAYLSQDGILSGDYEDFGATENTFLIIVSGLMITGLLFFVYRLKPESRPDLIQNEPEK